MPPDVTAVVLTHLRPRLAGDLVRSLITAEGFAPSRVVVVVSGAGGLDDPDLESTVRMLRLERNLGPAGGFRAGLLEAFSDPTVAWSYLCEDDVGLFDLPVPRVSALLERVETLGRDASQVGAVVAYGRRFVGRSGHAVNYVPTRISDSGLSPVDVAAWGATLVARSVVDAGVLPDPEWFFGYEDFDFFARVREAGFSVMVDEESALRMGSQQTTAGRDLAVGRRRPRDREEPWRGYYMSRNFFALARRHGHRSWIAWHLVYSLRRMQLAQSAEERRAILRGVWDGARGRLGENPRYGRKVGEFTDEET